MKLIKSNQGMGLNKSSHNFQSWVMIEHQTMYHDSLHLVACSITKDDMTLNFNSIMSKGYFWILKHKYNINSHFYHQ